MSEEKKNDRKMVRNRVYTSLLLAILALVAVTAATVAWFSIADKTKVNTMGLNITGDPDLRIDLDPHNTIDEYVKTLSFEDIAARVQQERGFSMAETPLEPVTTADEETFTYENGSVVSDTSGAYLTFTLHFMAEKDMLVHLTSADSESGAGDGTAVMSETAGLPESMRISFSVDGQTWIYDPGMGDSREAAQGASVFGLPGAAAMQLTDRNALFSLLEGEDKAVLVHIWMEGTDPACTDELRASDYSISLRFTGETTEKSTETESE